MALSIATIEADFKKVVSESVTYVDLADKVADNVAQYATEIPVVGADVANAVKLLDDFTKALNAVNAAITAA